LPLLDGALAEYAPAAGAVINPDLYPKSLKTMFLRHKAIREFFEKNPGLAETVADAVEDAVAVLKDPVRFYDPEAHFRAKDTINDALKVLSLPYAPSRIMIDNFIANPVMSWSFEDVKTQCFDPTQNMFLPYFEHKFDDIPLEGVDLVGISVADLSQLIPALTLAHMLKTRTDKKISLGGNYIYKIINDVKKPEFFDLFCDFITVGDGETAAVELCRHVEGSLAVEQVHSLVWNNGGEIVTNETAPLLKMDSLHTPDFSCFDLSQYFSPETVFPVQLGKGCYWSKCAFCDFYTGQQKFDIKSVAHAADEVGEIVEKYGAKNFIFVDEAVPPKYYDRLANELRRRGLKINFYSFARFDAGFTRPVLENLFDAGAKFFSWGYEAASERLLKLMNKGIVPAVRDRILADCVDIGIWTQCTFLLGYPTETPEELKQTLDVIENRELINSCTPSNFVLKKNAILKDETEEVGITDFTSNGDFHISYSYHAKNTTMETVKKNRMDFERRFLASTADCLWSLGFTDTDHLLLYLSRYGRDWVRDYRLKYKKKV
nr:radical SAM protein [Clostridia bacterium]